MDFSQFILGYSFQPSKRARLSCLNNSMQVQTAWKCQDTMSFRKVSFYMCRKKEVCLKTYNYIQTVDWWWQLHVVWGIYFKKCRLNKTTVHAIMSKKYREVIR